MPTISLLIFSINEEDKVVSLARGMYPIVDEIVVIDSSTKKNFSALKRKVKALRLAKIRLFHTVALGYAEPLRTYGISKCTNEWIFLLDVDEEPSEALKKNLKSLIQNPDFKVLKIRRHEGELKGKKFTYKFSTWQVRLFSKGALEYLGLTHETPKSFGKVLELNPKLGYIRHLDASHSREYDKMDLFNSKGTLYLILRDLVVDSSIGKIKSASDLLRMVKGHLELAKLRTNQTAAISRIIHSEGVTKYLMLDDQRVLKRLDKKYAGETQGIDLLIRLLKDRYNKNYP